MTRLYLCVTSNTMPAIGGPIMEPIPCAIDIKLQVDATFLIGTIRPIAIERPTQYGDMLIPMTIP